MSHQLTLLRHGLSVANQNQVIQGQLDFALSDAGRRQVEALASSWKAAGIHFDTLITSPLLRARETADILGAAFGLSPESEPDWMERRMGQAEGVNWEAFVAMTKASPPTSAFAPMFGDGESQWDLFVRAARAVQSVVRRPEGSYLIVSHGGILNAALRVILGISPSNPRPVRLVLDNCAYARVTFDGRHGTWTIEALNHSLPPGRPTVEP